MLKVSSQLVKQAVRICRVPYGPAGFDLYLANSRQFFSNLSESIRNSKSRRLGLQGEHKFLKRDNMYAIAHGKLVLTPVHHEFAGCANIVAGPMKMLAELGRNANLIPTAHTSEFGILITRSISAPADVR